MIVPDYYDVPIQAEMALGDFGRARLNRAPGQVGWCGGRMEVVVQVKDIRVYDVWVGQGEGEWIQLQRLGEAWTHEDIGLGAVKMRFWVVALEADGVPDLEEPTLDAAEVRPYVPIVDGEPPLPGRRSSLPSHLTRWVESHVDALLVASMLEEWTEAAAEAAALGWMCGLPQGGDLLMAYARSPGAAERVSEQEAAFGRWLVAELGRRVRCGLLLRRDAENRRASVQRLFPAIGRLLRAMDSEIHVVPTPPMVIGPSERHSWLVDEELADRLDNPVVVGGAHRPIFVVRPLLRHRGRVLLEGVVV